MAHKMSRKLGSELTTVSIAPEELSCCTVSCNTDDTEVVFGVKLNVFEILTRAGYNEDLTDKVGRIKAQGNGTDNLIEVKIFSNLLGFKHIADVTAVTLVPTETVHICSC